MLFALLLLVAMAVDATVPEHSVFLCGNGTDCAALFSNEWLAAAQEEAVRTYHTLNGGWLEPTCCGGAHAHGPEVRVRPFAANLGAVLCIPHSSFPDEECASKKCNFASHPELFQDDCSQLDGLCPSECRLSTDPQYVYRDISGCSKSSVVQGLLNSVPDEGGNNCEAAYIRCLYTAENATVNEPCFCPLPQPACTCTGTWEGNGKVYGATCTVDTESCRTIESWLDIAKWLLIDALEYTEQCEWELASSASCAAEFVYRSVNEWLLSTYAAQAAELQFINPMARQLQRYTHINSPLRTVTFDGTLFTAQVRVVQSVRTCASCGDASDREPVTSLLVYSSASGDADTLEVTQLVWALSGVLADFGTVLPFAVNNECGLQHIHSNLPLFASARRVPRLGAQDWATVRCDGAPRETTDLRIEAVCPVVLLFAALAPGEPTDELHSLAQLQLRDGFAPLAPLAAAQLLEAALALRVATGTGGECHDYSLLLAANVYDNCSLVEQPLAIISEEHQSLVPLTLAPGTSRCVGGTNDGQECNARSECRAGSACRRKPFEPDTVAFCYDGLVWHADQPCAFADEDASCPYGTCVGAANGFDGGLFPLLHFHQEAECASGASDASACQHGAVANWHKYPNLALFKQ